MWSLALQSGPQPRKEGQVRPDRQRSHAEEYMAKVETVREGIGQGDYYEVVLRQTFRAPYSGRPSELFEQDSAREPESLRIFPAIRRRAIVGASPEMFVRVEGRAHETCPIPEPRSAPAILYAMPTHPRLLN